MEGRGLGLEEPWSGDSPAQHWRGEPTRGPQKALWMPLPHLSPVSRSYTCGWRCSAPACQPWKSGTSPGPSCEAPAGSRSSVSSGEDPALVLGF